MSEFVFCDPDNDSNDVSIFNKALAIAINAPMVKIEREEFLKNNFSREVEPELVNKIVQTSPIKAGVSERILEKIARECIKNETYQVSALSLGTGFYGLVGIPADLAQYLVHVLRISQKLAYIYGYPSMISIDGGMDDASKNIILLFIGMMYGVKGTEKVIAKLSVTLAEQIAKNISREALTKTVWYPLLKQVCKQVGIQVTKDTLGKAAAKSIPVLASVVSATLSYICFEKNAERLHETLRENPVR